MCPVNPTTVPTDLRQKNLEELDGALSEPCLVLRLFVCLDEPIRANDHAFFSCTLRKTEIVANLDVLLKIFEIKLACKDIKLNNKAALYHSLRLLRWHSEQL